MQQWFGVRIPAEKTGFPGVCMCECECEMVALMSPSQCFSPIFFLAGTATITYRIPRNPSLQKRGKRRIKKRAGFMSVLSIAGLKLALVIFGGVFFF